MVQEALISTAFLQWRRQGGQRGTVAPPPPHVEKDGPRNSSKFDEKIAGGWVSISDVKKS